ncbi:MAG: hypothetical protein JXR96_11780, partial [Deltaproteobacteria bacterium]|nr:hypothetical protein [Deltaproteobacteria bacterium]
MRCARWISLSLACLLMGACTSTETATECGNGVKQGSEECDGEDLGHMSCSDFIGLAYGRLGCTLDCRFDTSGCIPVDKECSRDADCDRFAGEGEKLCCAEVDPGFSICVEIDPNYACGDGTGGCGASCTGKSHSACLPGHPCLADSLDDPNAICSHQCVTDADCRDCELDEIEFSCQAISGGDKYCLDAAGQACSRHADCPGGEVCMVDVVDGLLRGTCGRQGALDPGAECDDEDEPDDLPYEERCAALYCFYGFCSEVCTLDSDCPEGMTCERVGFIELPDQTIDMCFGYDHGWPGGPGDPCIFGSVNADSEYCQRGLACLGYDPEQLGEPCERDADCLEVLPPAQNPDCTAEGLCGASFCSP